MNDENFLNQIDAAKLMHQEFISASDERKRIVAREVLESFVVLQQFLSEAIVDVYKVYDEAVKK